MKFPAFPYYYSMLKNRFKPLLKQMPRAPSFTIKIHSISNIDPFYCLVYCLAQVRMRGFDQKVIVIGHQAISMHFDRLALHACLKYSKNPDRFRF